MSEQITKLLAAAGQTSGATSDIIDAAADGEIKTISNVGAGDTLIILADGMRLLIEATSETNVQEGFQEDANQLYGAVVRFLDGQS